MFILFLIENHVSNSEDPDQTLCSAASVLGLHCLSMSQKWDTRLIWVKFVLQNQNSLIVKSFIRTGI